MSRRRRIYIEPTTLPGPVHGQWRDPVPPVPPPKKKSPSPRSLVGTIISAVLLVSGVATCGVMLVMPMFELPAMLEDALRACQGPGTQEACFDAMNLPADLRRDEYERIFVPSSPGGFQELDVTKKCRENSVADVRGIAYFATHNQPVAGAFRRIEGEWVLLRFGPASDIPRGCGGE